MPSLLSRFLGKKKNADQSSLLDGEKFEAVPKTTSPLASTFAESAQRPKSKGAEQQSKGEGKRQKRPFQNASGAHGSKQPESMPVLSLSLTESKGEEKKSSGLGVVFEGITDAPTKLDEAALGDKRLTPSEALVLVQKTSEVITQRGLETLGVMRPHWFASPRQQEIQLKLIDRFLQTLSSQQADTSSPSQATSFESELQYSRDPHDVAAVFRWGLRHLQLERNAFGSSGAGDWYRTFSDSERSGSYPVKAFDDVLVPLLPAAHTQLLRAILDMVSSLAAHSEENGISGNKLSKVLGWWIIGSRNIQGSGWQEFYAQWEIAARQFEHLFLAYIRTQQAQSRMPKRLTELVKNYPFAKNRREGDGIYLPRPQFSTRSTDALFIRITADKSGTTSRPHPLRIVEDAFRASAGSQSSTGEYMALWEEIRKIASKVDQTQENEQTDEAAPVLNLSTVLADESIRLLTLVPTPEGEAAPTLSLFTPLPAGRARRSLSVGDRSPTSPTANGRSFATDLTGHNRSTTAPPSTSQEHDVTADWQLFSSSGFNSPSGLSLAASLWDNDTEVTQPTPKKSLGAGKRNLSIRSASPRRRSADLPAPIRIVPASSAGEKPGRFTYGAPHLVKLDEAFIDFWADSLLDSIARTWPTFVVCQLKSVPALRIKEDSKPIEWLVIERVTGEPSRLPPAIKPSSASARAASPVQHSPTSERGKSPRWTATTLGGSRKRWSFFSPRHDSAPAVQGGKDRATKKAAKDHKVGEMGEIIREEDEGKANGVKTNGLHLEVPREEVLSPPPAIQVNGVSKSNEPVSAEKVEPSTVEKQAVAEKTTPAQPVAPAPSTSAEPTPVAPVEPAPVAAEEELPSTDTPSQAAAASVEESEPPVEAPPVADAPTKPTAPPQEEPSVVADAEPADDAPPAEPQPPASPVVESHSEPVEEFTPSAEEEVAESQVEDVEPQVEEAIAEPHVEEAATEPQAATEPHVDDAPLEEPEEPSPSAPVAAEPTEPDVDGPVEPDTAPQDDPVEEPAAPESEPTNEDVSNTEPEAEAGAAVPEADDAPESESPTTKDAAAEEAPAETHTLEHPTEVSP